MNRYAKLLAALRELPSQYRIDAAESVFLERELESVRSQAYEVEYPELKWRMFVPVNSDPSPADNVYKYDVYDKVGQADVISNYADDLKRVDLTGSEVFQRMVSLGDAYGWNVQELRGAAKEGKNLPARKAAAARYFIENLLDEIMLEGRATEGLNGLFNLSGTETYTTPNGAGGDTEWDTKTPDEILADMHGISNRIHEQSNEVERPDTLILPTSRYGLVSTTKMGDGENISILQAFLARDEHVRSVMKSYRLETAGSGSSKRMVCYTRREDKVSGLMGQEFEQFPPQLRNLEVITNCHARTGGVIAPFPKSIAYGDNI